jgi:hypothetical protein
MMNFCTAFKYAEILFILYEFFYLLSFQYFQHAKHTRKYMA